MKNKLECMDYEDAENSSLDLEVFELALDKCTFDGTTKADPVAIAFAYFYKHSKEVFRLARLGAAVEAKCAEIGPDNRIKLAVEIIRLVQP